MQNTSENYKRLIKQSGRTLRVKIICTFPNSTQIILDDSDIIQNSLKISSATSNEGSFDIGCAIINELNFDIENSTGRFTQTDFSNAIFDIRIGLVISQKWDGTLETEWLRKGYYIAEDINLEEKYISIIAYDYMSKFDVEYKPSGLSATLGEILDRICKNCGITNGILYNFPNFDLIVSDTIEYIDEQTTYRDMVSYIAQLACSFAYINTDGHFMLGWYQDTNCIIDEHQKLAAPVAITGVQIVDALNNNDLYLLGNEGYVVSIDNNPLAQISTYNPLSNAAFNDRLINYKIIPFECNMVSDPSIEPGDVITVCDLNGNKYKTPVTNVLFLLDSKMTIVCDAKTLNEKQRAGGSQSSKIIAAAKLEMKKQISSYNTISQIAANAMGYFETLVQQDDGSIIGYMHDKPSLNESVTIWKKTVDGIFISNDGGKTYSKGIDRDGNAAVKTVSTHGITVSDVQKTFTTNITPGIFQLLVGNKVYMEGNASNGISIYNGGLSIYKGASTESEKIITLDQDGNAAFSGYITQPGSSIKAIVGKNVYGNPGFFIYRISDKYKKNDGTYKPYIEFWNSTNSQTIITGTNCLKICVETLTDETFVPLECNQAGGALYGTWYASSGQAITSDKNKKHDIESLDEKYSNLFNNLNPVRYRFDDGTSDRYHTGFIAQEVEQAVKAAGLSDSDFAGYLKDQDGNYFLRYDEIIALLVSEVQMLKKQYADLLEIIKERS